MPYLQSTIKVLIVDDDEDDFFITSDLIRQIPDISFEIDWCYNYDKGIQQLKQHSHQIYFVDYRLGAKTGIDFLKDAMQLQCEEPIILVTGKGNRAIDIEAMRIGATDYLIKGEITTDKLERSIRYALERSASLKALKSNERKFRNIFERSKDAVFIADTAMQFKDLNRGATDMLGFSIEELKQMDLYQLLGPETNKNDLQAKLMETGNINEVEAELVVKSGEKIYVILSASVEKDMQDEAYVQGMIHDITNLKKAERANLQVEKLAATGRLVRTLAHEVRNPLNNINMSVEQLQLLAKEEEANIYLDIIHRNSHRIGDLIKELLGLSKPTELVFEKRTLQGVMDETISAALDRITLKRINMQIKYTDLPAYILADAGKLNIAFLNIIINAIEAMEDRQGNLSVSISSANDQHKVTIEDNGEGIPEENIPLLFEPYFTSKRNGMGLGLAATLNILQSHKALVDVKSKPGLGTTFTILFPIAN